MGGVLRQPNSYFARHILHCLALTKPSFVSSLALPFALQNPVLQGKRQRQTGFCKAQPLVLQNYVWHTLVKKAIDLHFRKSIERPLSVCKATLDTLGQDNSKVNDPSKVIKPD